MEVLQGIGYVLAAIAALAVFAVILYKLAILLAIAFFFLPMIAGVVGCSVLWNTGYDNEGILLLVVLVVAQFPWTHWVSGWRIMQGGATSLEGRDWRDSKIKLYDEKGRVKGYKDRE